MQSFPTTATITNPGQTKRPRQARHRPPSACKPRDRFQIRSLERRDEEAVAAMLGRCSPATRYRRFQGVTDGISYVTQVFAGDHLRDAFAAWSGDRCIGLATLAADRDGSTHMGVLVEDAWQRQGVGSAVVAALVDRARQRRLPSFTVEVLADNQFILPRLARIGPATTSIVYGAYRMCVDLGTNGVLRSGSMPR